MVVEEVIRIRFDENKPNKESFSNPRLDDNFIATSSSRQNSETKASTQQEIQKEIRKPSGCIMRRNHLESQIIGVPTYHVQTRSSLKTQGHIALISEIEPKHIDDAMQDNNWTEAIQEEHDRFQKNDVWNYKDEKG